MFRVRFLFLVVVSVILFTGLVSAQTTVFTYQGSLRDGASSANGNYDFEFKLFDAVSDGTQQGGTIQRLNVFVTSGVFTVSLDFGSPVLPGDDRFLEFAVRTAGGGAFTTLIPRQRIHSAPYSIRSLNATVADLATNSLNLGGVAANQYVVTTDPRMTDARSPTAGSSNYIQNQNTAAQASSNFDISGIGTASVFSAGTQFNIGSDRILSVFGTSPNQGLSVGLNAGTAGSINSFFGNRAGITTTGGQNSFFGSGAGESNTTGTNNSFFGVTAGRNTTTLGNNSFFGTNAGNFNTGSGNSYFGSGAGSQNTNGSENAFFGLVAGSTIITGNNLSLFGARAFAFNNLTNASAIGFRAMVTQDNSVVLGSINGTNGATADTNVGIGTTAPSERLHVVGNQLITGNLSVNGTITGTYNGTVSTATNALNLGGIPAAQYAQVSALDNLNASNITSGTLSNARLGVIPDANGGTGLATSGTSGNFLRSDGSGWVSSTLQPSDFPAGNPSYIQNTTALQPSSNFNISGIGSANTFDAASQYNVGGLRVLTASGGLVQNTFAGVSAGSSNPAGGSNSFFGFNAGTNTSSGNSNSFFGAGAGQTNTGGTANTFVGTSAGRANVAADGNSFVGNAAGLLNTGSQNTFIGREAGRNNTDGFDNTFVGTYAGDMNDTGFRNTVIGESADVLSAGLTNATAIGSRAGVAQSNSLVLGSINGVNFATADAKVGIGTTAPNARLQVQNGNIYVGSPGQGMILRSPDGATCRLLSIDNAGVMVLAPIICP